MKLEKNIDDVILTREEDHQ